MKKYIFFFVALFALNIANAQSKMAHLNSQEVMASMPSYAAAVKKLEAFQYEVNQELEAMIADYEKEIKKLEEMIASGSSPTLIDIQKQKLAKKEQAIMEREQSIQAEVEAYSRELNRPIVYRIETALKIVSERHGYDYVFDTSVLMRANGPDITKEMIQEVLKLEESPIMPPPQEDIIETNN